MVASDLVVAFTNHFRIGAADLTSESDEEGQTRYVWAEFRHAPTV